MHCNNWESYPYLAPSAWPYSTDSLSSLSSTNTLSKDLQNIFPKGLDEYFDFITKNFSANIGEIQLKAEKELVKKEYVISILEKIAETSAGKNILKALANVLEQKREKLSIAYNRHPAKVEVKIASNFSIYAVWGAKNNIKIF